MKANKEIRAEAWGLLWREGWFMRLLAVGVILSVVMIGALLGLYFAYKALGVESLSDFQRAKLNAAAAGLDFTAPSSEASMRMWLGSLFQNFIQHLFSGLVMFGMVSVLLKAVRRDAKGWFASAFGGFQMPFSAFWLWFRVQFQTALWMLMTLVPTMVVVSVVLNVLGFAPTSPGGLLVIFLGCLPAALVFLWVLYRYQLAWFLKAEHPEWRAGRCIARSVELMRGLKRRAVSLDCSYWLWILLLIPFLVPNGLLGYAIATDSFGNLSALQLAMGGVSLLLSVTLGMVVYWYIALGHAIFYREIQQES